MSNEQQHKRKEVVGLSHIIIPSTYLKKVKGKNKISKYNHKNQKQK